MRLLMSAPRNLSQEHRTRADVLGAPDGSSGPSPQRGPICSQLTQPQSIPHKGCASLKTHKQKVHRGEARGNNCQPSPQVSVTPVTDTPRSTAPDTRSHHHPSVSAGFRGRSSHRAPDNPTEGAVHGHRPCSSHVSSTRRSWGPGPTSVLPRRPVLSEAHTEKSGDSGIGTEAHRALTSVDICMLKMCFVMKENNLIIRSTEENVPNLI